MKSPLRAISVALVGCMLAMFSFALTPQENAWLVLNSRLTNKSWEKRARAVAILGELTGDKKAEDAALAALRDERAQARGAAAQALGEMGAKSAIPQLLDMINDTEPSAILAAAHSLVMLGDDRGYNVF